MISFLYVDDDGKIVAVQPNAAVADSLIGDIFKWKEEGISMDDIIDQLRAQTVPTGYPFHPWKNGSLI